MQAESASGLNGVFPLKTASKIMNTKHSNPSDPKPKMNIALDGSTYTKTIDLKPQDFFNLSGFDGLGVGQKQSYSQMSTSINGQNSHSLCVSVEPAINPTSVSKNRTLISNSFSRGKIRSVSRSAFFSRLTRRLTIRRSNSKPPPATATSSVDENALKPHQLPTGKIRRWFSKHLIPNYKNSPTKPSSESFTARAATFDGKIDKLITQPSEDFGSAPTHRRVLPPPNFSDSSLCNSQTGNLSLGDDSFEINGASVPQKVIRPYEKERLMSTCASGSIPTKADNHATQISSAFSSPSVTATGPPPCYLNVSLAAFGYTCCNRKWVSAQTLERGKTPLGGDREPNPTSTGTTNTTSAFLGPTLTPQRHKSSSPVPVSRNGLVERPYHLDLYDGCDRPDASSTPRVSGLASPTSQNGDNTTCVNNSTKNTCSGVTIRVKRNVSNGNSSQLPCCTDSADQTQSDLNRSNHSHHEHWNRSSLIMLAVAQASPRTHNAPTTPNGNGAAPLSQSQAVANGSNRLSFSDTAGNTGVPPSPSKTLLRRRLTSNEEVAELQLPKVDEIPFLNSDVSHEEGGEVEKKKTMSNNSGGLEEITTSFRNSTISIANRQKADNSQTMSNAPATQVTANKDEGTRDGYFFLHLADETELELRSRVEEIEKDLQENELSEEVSGHLRTTVGKVNLLLSQKFVQFRGLCADCIATSEKKSKAEGEGSEFVTLPSDLEGFWAMVMLQVDDLHSMIASCDRLRQNGWKTDPNTETTALSVKGTTHLTPASTKRRQLRSANSTPAKDNKTTAAAALARNQARERLRAAKLQYMRARKEELAASNTTNGSISNSEVLTAGSSVGNESGEGSTFLVL